MKNILDYKEKITLRHLIDNEITKVIKVFTADYNEARHTELLNIKKKLIELNII